MNIERFLDLSTAHLSPAARSWLSECATENHAVGYHGSGNGGLISTLGATAFGYFMHAPEGDKPSTMPDELYAICKKARAVGCPYILFDRDALEMESLATYDDDGNMVEPDFIEPDDAGIADEIAEPGELNSVFAPYGVDMGGAPMDPPMFSGLPSLEDIRMRDFRRRADALIAAVDAVMPDIAHEIEQRRDGGNDEVWEPLDAKYKALHDAVQALTR